MKTNYVLGFALDLEGEGVLLMYKLKPEWQKGLLNGVGGKIEEGETPMQAMIREFKEETNLDSKESDWKQFATMGNDDWSCACFVSKTINIEKAESVTEEDLIITNFWSFEFEETISNIPWLVHMAIDALKDNITANIQY